MEKTEEDSSAPYLALEMAATERMERMEATVADSLVTVLVRKLLKHPKHLPLVVEQSFFSSPHPYESMYKVT